MPELPDVVTYLEAIERRALGQPLERVRLASAFLLRSVEPPLSAFEGRRLEGTRRLGKRLVLGFEGDLYLVLHLMIAGRLHWKAHGAKVPGGKRGLAAFDFAPGTLILTEAGTQKRAALYAVAGETGLGEHDPGGLEVLEADLDAFRARLAERHTLKRSLTDPHLFSGIGNAYSDEILHRARLSPLRYTTQLDDAEIERLHAAARDVLVEWTERLRRDTGDDFPEKVTAFRPGMAVHGRYGEPCPRCGAPVQRILYATHEANYCAPCQTGGKLLADRALSRLMKEDWPRTLEELEQRRGRARGA